MQQRAQSAAAHTKYSARKRSNAHKLQQLARSAAEHAKRSRLRKLQRRTESAAAHAKHSSACKVQQHTQRAAAHAKCSSARKVQLRTLDVNGHGNSGCASVSVCGKITWSNLLAGTSPQYDRVIFCADATSNPHHDTDLGSSLGHAQTCVVIQEQFVTKWVTFTLVT